MKFIVQFSGAIGTAMCLDELEALLQLNGHDPAKAYTR
jgi:hypothetical protein